MRRYPLLANLLLAVILFAIALISNADSDKYGVIRGKIFFENDRTAVGQASVELVGTDFKTTTNQYGFFEFKNVPVGNYSLLITGVNNVTSQDDSVLVQADVNSNMIYYITRGQNIVYSVNTGDSTGTRNSISGTITDQNTSSPVVGAAVQIDGTKLGAISDFNGFYQINNVPDGTYKLRVTSIEYNTVVVEDVKVGKGPIKLDFSANKKVSELDVVITVKGEKDILDKYDVGSQVTVGKEKIAHQPVTTVAELLTQVSGVKTNKSGEVYIRGSRTFSNGYYANGGSPAHGGNAIVNNEPYDAMFFKNYGVNPFVDTEDDHLSTFAIDVDDASYIMARSYLNGGNFPPDEAIRVEEFVNHFNYNYRSSGESPFDFYLEGSPSRFGQNAYLVRIGIKGRDVAPENRKAANLVFVVDVSGSMSGESRLGLVRKSLRLLVDQLTPNDKVGIVVYGSQGQEILRPTSDKNQIISAIEQLYSSGATNAEEGIRLGYEMMDRVFEPGKINRIILCSDGVANVGRTGPDQILEMIKKYADKGITLSSIGFGMGNYNDIMLEKLGNKGNGYYAYVDNLEQAKKIFVDNLTGTLEVIARDVKIQVDFDTTVVRSYRLLGYENRDVADEKFRDDKEDGGEVGAGHSATALYEIKFKDKSNGILDGNFGTIYLRYKDPDNMDNVTEIKNGMNVKIFKDEFENASANFRLAACAAQFSEILRKSYWAKDEKLADLAEPVKQLVLDSNDPDIVELYGLIVKADQYQEQRAEK